MPSCTGTDVQNRLFMTAAPAAPDCWKERYCYERDVNGGEECRPGRCVYGGKEHARSPCPDHDLPRRPAISILSGEDLTPRAAARRAESVAKLIPAVRDAVKALHAAALEGGLEPAEISAVQELQMWLRALLDEQDAPRVAARERPEKQRKTKRR